MNTSQRHIDDHPHRVMTYSACHLPRLSEIPVIEGMDFLNNTLIVGSPSDLEELHYARFEMPVRDRGIVDADPLHIVLICPLDTKPQWDLISTHLRIGRGLRLPTTLFVPELWDVPDDILAVACVVEK